MRYIICLILAAIFISSTSASAGYREDFEREFMSKPWVGEVGEENACISCHASEKMAPEMRDIPQGLQASIHYQYNISCHDCHGGDPKDPDQSMSKHRGFVGSPKYDEVPEFCGKCHVGILKNYLESGHGIALKKTGNGPNCVTCHGSHKNQQFIQKATIDIINEQRCSKCHSYERAKTMKQALFLTEKKITEVEDSLKKLREGGVFTEEQEKILFSTHAEFRTLFHSIDINLIKERSDDFIKRLGIIEKDIQNILSELRFRRNFSAFILLLFAGIGVVIFIISRTPKE